MLSPNLIRLRAHDYVAGSHCIDGPHIVIIKLVAFESIYKLRETIERGLYMLFDAEIAKLTY